MATKETNEEVEMEKEEEVEEEEEQKENKYPRRNGKLMTFRSVSTPRQW
jgi:hypothetical protein